MKGDDALIVVQTDGTPENTAVIVNGAFVDWWSVKIVIEHGGPNVDERIRVRVCAADLQPNTPRE